MMLEMKKEEIHGRENGGRPTIRYRGVEMKTGSRKKKPELM